LFGKDYDQYLVVPRFSISLSTEEKRAIMDLCREQRQSLSQIISDHLTTLAHDLTGPNENHTPSEQHPQKGGDGDD